MIKLIKCVIWDLDNTLWKGILAEDGVVEIRQEIVDLIIKLNQHGIINSISSRNDFKYTMNKLKEFGIDEYFILPQISWNTKSEGIRFILDNLNIKDRDVLFVDDNPFERDEVLNNIKDISVNDGSSVTSILEQNDIRFTVGAVESKERVKLYKDEEKRVLDKLEFNYDNVEFLKHCKIILKFRKAVLEDIERIKELIDRTNQMNATAIRYEKEEIIHSLTDSNFQIIVAEVSDKYGDYGRSALLILKGECFDKPILTVENFIISCRLMGKGVAQTILALAYRIAEMQNKNLRVRFRRTKYNRQLVLLLQMNGFELSFTEGKDNYYIYNNEKTKCKIPEWIKIEEVEF